jgi:hypothetical protein
MLPRIPSSRFKVEERENVLGSVFVVYRLESIFPSSLPVLATSTEQLACLGTHHTIAHHVPASAP